MGSTSEDVDDNRWSRKFLAVTEEYVDIPGAAGVWVADDDDTIGSGKLIPSCAGQSDDVEATSYSFNPHTESLLRCPRAL